MVRTHVFWRWDHGYVMWYDVKWCDVMWCDDIDYKTQLSAGYGAPPVWASAPYYRDLQNNECISRPGAFLSLSLTARVTTAGTEYLDLQQGRARSSCSLDSRNAEIRGGYSKLCLTPSSSDFIVPLSRPGCSGMAAVTGPARLQVEQNKQYSRREGREAAIMCREWSLLSLLSPLSSLSSLPTLPSSSHLLWWPRVSFNYQPGWALPGYFPGEPSPSVWQFSLS